MKSFIKICLKISGVFLAIGIVLCIIGAAFGAVDGFRQFFLDGGYAITFRDDSDIKETGVKYLKDSSESFLANQINNLQVNMKYGEMNVYPYEGTDIKVDTKNPTKHFTCRQEGDTLVIVDERSHQTAFRIGIGVGADYTTVNVYVPEDKIFTTAKLKMGAGDMQAEYLKAEELTVDVGAGEFTSEGIIAENTSSISVGMGHLQIVDSSLNNLSLNVGTGAVEFSGTLIGDNKISCELGSVVVDLTGKETDYNYQIQCDMGEVRIGNSSYSGLSNWQSVDYQADHSIHIECGVGQVSVEFEK